MDAVKFLEELARMATHGLKNQTVTDFYITVETQHPVLGEQKFSFSACEDVVLAVQRWSAFHPRKTRLQDFLEKYPNAEIDHEENRPFVTCAARLGYLSVDDCPNDCAKCWNQPL